MSETCCVELSEQRPIGEMGRQTWNASRFSVLQRPAIGQECYFSLLPEDNNRPMCQTYLKSNAVCVVVANSKRLVEVRFTGRRNTDIISPDYLLQKTVKSEESGGGKN